MSFRSSNLLQLKWILGLTKKKKKTDTVLCTRQYINLKCIDYKSINSEKKIENHLKNMQKLRLIYIWLFIIKNVSPAEIIKKVDDYKIDC